jgi:hypothetical protein
MKKMTLLSIFVCISFISFSQDLFIGSASSITILSDATLYVNGLGLEPDADYTINPNTNINRSSIPVAKGDVVVRRRINSTSSLEGYTGTVLFKYEDDEIEGGSEEDLQLELYNTTDALWAHYNATLNTYENTLTYNFMSAVSFNAVTLGYKGTVEIENPNLSIKVYPNPTIDKVSIKYNYPISTTLYNALGQLIAKGNTHEIDLSAYQSATYFLIIEDASNQNTYSFKIFKQ